MASRYFQTLVGLLAGSGGGPSFPTIANPITFGIGDSVRELENYLTTIGSGVTFTRSASGVITGATAAGNQLFGTPNAGLVNMTDTSYEVISRNTYNASSIYGGAGGGSAAVELHTSNLSAGTTTSLATNAAVVNQDRFSWRGTYAWLASLLKSGIDTLGQLGHGGIAAPFTSQITYALSLTGPTPTLLRYQGGVNNVKLGQNAATTWANIKLDLDQIIVGGIPCLVSAVTPLGAGVSGYVAFNATIVTVNASISAYCAANPTKLLFADVFTPVYDAPNTCLLAAYTSDGVHCLDNGCAVMGQAEYNAIASKLTISNILPSAAADAGTTVNGHTRLVARGPWVTTTGGGFTAGGSGTLPPSWVAGRSSGSGLIVCSIVDPGDGLGMKVQLVAQAGAAQDTVTCWPWGNGGVTLASLGISASDGNQYAFAAEIDWSGASAAGVACINMQIGSQTSGLYGFASCGEPGLAAVVPGSVPDAMTGMTVRTGWLQASDATMTLFLPALNIKFTTTLATNVTVNIRRVMLLKK